MPTEYWLGRLISLVDLYHHEGNYGSSGRSSTPAPEGFQVDLSGDSENSAAERARTQAAIHCLLQSCQTEEARSSLRAFIQAYRDRHGGPRFPQIGRSITTSRIVSIESVNNTSGKSEGKKSDDKVGTFGTVTVENVNSGAGAHGASLGRVVSHGVIDKLRGMRRSLIGGGGEE